MGPYNKGSRNGEENRNLKVMLLALKMEEGAMNQGM